jgi:hypothetical protein
LTKFSIFKGIVFALLFFYIVQIFKLLVLKIS